MTIATKLKKPTLVDIANLSNLTLEHAVVLLLPDAANTLDDKNDINLLMQKFELDLVNRRITATILECDEVELKTWAKILQLPTLNAIIIKYTGNGEITGTPWMLRLKVIKHKVVYGSDSKFVFHTIKFKICE